MIFHEYKLDYYLSRMRNNDYFAMAGYSDAEWFCVTKQHIGDRTGLGQIIDDKHGDRLADVLKRHYWDERFLVAVPKCLWTDRPSFNHSYVDHWLAAMEMPDMVVYERDMITDDLACEAQLFPLINQLRDMNVCIIGNQYLRGLDFLNYDHFVEIESPNLHMTKGGIEQAVAEARRYGMPGIYLVSAGVSAAVIIDHLCNVIPNSFFMDCGSIWDCFVGIGGQREWRRKLYANPAQLIRWRSANLYNTAYYDECEYSDES